MLVLLGSNHDSAPVSLRERMAIGPEELGETLEGMLAVDGIEEALVLSTCNRVELLARFVGGNEDGLVALKRFLQQNRGLSAKEVERYTYHYRGREVARHLFRVAAGLDSMILGEPQILGQVKQAYRTAKRHGSMGPILDRLLQHCFGAAKRARTETGISRHAVSVAFAAVELARNIFRELSGRAVLLLGAGKMSDLVARHFVSNGIDELVVASRTYNHAVEAAERVGGRAVHWDDGLAQLAKVDIVVSATGAPRQILSKRQVAEALRGRRGGPLFLIDIAVPRDVDPAVNDLDNAYLYDIDALQNVIDSNLEERRHAAERAEELVDEEVRAFERWRQSQAIAPMIVTLRESMLEVGRREVGRFRRKLGTLSVEQEQTVEELTRAVIQKLLHRPIRHLRQAVERGEVERCASLYREIFDLDFSRRSATGPPRKHEASGRDHELDGEQDRDRDDEPPGPRRVLRGGRES